MYAGIMGRTTFNSCGDKLRVLREAVANTGLQQIISLSLLSSTYALMSCTHCALQVSLRYCFLSLRPPGRHSGELNATFAEFTTYALVLQQRSADFFVFV